MAFDNSLIDKIDFSKSNHYTLSIRLSTDGFSFSIYNPISEDSLSYFSYDIDPNLPMAVNIRKMFDEYPIFGYSYKEINVVYISDRFTFIPFDIFEEEQADSFFYYNFTKKENEIVLTNLLRKTNTVLAFGVNKATFQELTKQFPSFHIYSQPTIVAEHFAHKSRFGNSKKMYLYFREDKMDIFCYERSKLIFGNTFQIQHTNDILYYALYIWKQLEFNQEKDELHMAGIEEQKEELKSKIKEYIHQVFIINSRAELYTNGKDKIPYDIQLISLKEV